MRGVIDWASGLMGGGRGGLPFHTPFDVWWWVGGCFYLSSSYRFELTLDTLSLSALTHSQV